MRFSPALVCALVAAALGAQGPAAGRRRKPATPTVARTHLRYSWQERVDALVISHELNLYGNGFIRYLQRPGTGTPHETTLPNDPAFVAEAEKRFVEARGARGTHPPCGAPQGGILEVQLGRRVDRFDLTRPEQWSRYGRLARLLVGRVVGALPAPLEADCQPLKLRVDPSQVATARRGPTPIGTRAEEAKLLLAYGAASREEERRALLYRLATLRDGDRFFRIALLRRYGGSLEARRLLRRYASVLVRGVRSEVEAEELLSHLGRLKTAEGMYHQAVLERVRRRHAEAARLQLGFRQALNQLGLAARATEELRLLGTAEMDSRRIRPPWAVIRRALGRLFEGWLDLAEEVWAGDPEEAPPLALLLYRRALHYATLSVLSSPGRAGRGGARAWALLKSHLPRLTRGRWDGLPPWARQDLIFSTGLLRRLPAGPDRAWVAQALEDPAVTVCRLVRMRYFDVAERFVGRMVEQRKAQEGALRFAQGRCLREMERFGEARRAFAQAASLNVPGAREARVQLLLDQGDLQAAEQEVEAVVPKTAAAWRATSRLYRLLGRGEDAVEAARRAARAAAGGAEAETWLVLGRASALVGRSEEARAAFREAARGEGDVALEARERWARLELSLGRPREALEAAWPLTRHRDAQPQVAGNALVALVAARRSQPALVSLMVERARYHAHRDPRALLRLALLLAEGGRGQAAGLEALRLAIGLRPGWSVLYAQQAQLFGQIRRLPEALVSIGAALRIRGAYPPYRALESALVRLAASGRGGDVDAVPDWAQARPAAASPDARPTQARPSPARPRPATPGAASSHDAGAVPGRDASGALDAEAPRAGGAPPPRERDAEAPRAAPARRAP